MTYFNSKCMTAYPLKTDLYSSNAFTLCLPILTRPSYGCVFGLTQTMQFSTKTMGGCFLESQFSRTALPNLLVISDFLKTFAGFWACVLSVVAYLGLPFPLYEPLLILSQRSTIKQNTNANVFWPFPRSVHNSDVGVVQNSRVILLTHESWFFISINLFTNLSLLLPAS